MYGVIYLIVCKLNGMKYVGQTVNFRQRINQHKIGKQYVDLEIQKYGWENFTVEILEECESRNQLNERENFWIRELNCKHPNGYNLAGGGIKLTDCEDKKRTRKPSANAGNFLSAEHRAKISATERNESPFKNLSDTITAYNLSYTALAKILGVSRPTVSFKMCGRINFTAKDRDTLVELFSLPADYLFLRDDGLPAIILSETERYERMSVARRVETPYKNLLAEMDERQISYKKLKKLLGLKSGSVSHKMRGKQNFTAKQVAKLVEIFGKPADYLLST